MNKGAFQCFACLWIVIAAGEKWSGADFSVACVGALVFAVMSVGAGSR